MLPSVLVPCLFNFELGNSYLYIHCLPLALFGPTRRQSIRDL
jgi:hypothetical protein